MYSIFLHFRMYFASVRMSLPYSGSGILSMNALCIKTYVVLERPKLLSGRTPENAKWISINSMSPCMFSPFVCPLHIYFSFVYPSVCSSPSVSLHGYALPVCIYFCVYVRLCICPFIGMSFVYIPMSLCMYVLCVYVYPYILLYVCPLCISLPYAYSFHMYPSFVCPFRRCIMHIISEPIKILHVITLW